MTTTRREINPLGTPANVATAMQPKVIKSYEGKAPAEPHVPEVVPNDRVPSDESPVESQVEENESSTEDTASATEVQSEKSNAQKRAERRDAVREAEKKYQQGLQLQRDAQEKLEKAEQFYKLMETAKDNPVAVAQALGVDPTEFLRKYQNQIFNIKEEEPQVDPQEQVKQTLEQYKKEREAERQQLMETQANIVRSNYIAQKILPVLAKDPDKFELTHKANMEASAHLIYDVMNEHYRKTGEELSVQEVAEAYEAKLEEQAMNAMKNSKEIKKLAKFFAQEAPPPAQKEEVVRPKSKTLSNNLTAAPPSMATPSKNYGTDRDARIRRVLDKFGK